MSNRKRLTALDDRRKDKALPFLTVQQADRVRSLLSEALAERGLQVTVFNDHLRAADGREFGVWNVASRCHAAGRSESAWRPVINDHVDKLMASFAAGDPFKGLSEEDLRTRTYTRLWQRDAMPGGASEYPSVEFVPGVLEVITLRIPGGVAPFHRDRVEEYGGWERLHDLGRANLAACEPEGVEFMTTKEGATFVVARGESTFTASLALLMPGFADPVERVLDHLHDDGPADESLGWLLAVPNRHELVWHTIRDEQAISAWVGMTLFAPMAHADSPGPLSPHVFWWSGEGYRQVTSYTEDGRITGVLDRQLLERLEKVA